jgi:hypothetical protein
MASVNTVATSAVAVAVAVVSMIGDRPAVELQDTIFTIGEETLAAEKMLERGEELLDTLAGNMFDIVKDLPYDQFMIVRDFYKSGVIDKGRTDDAAQKMFERTCTRMAKLFTVKDPETGVAVAWKKPVSVSPDAVRKAAKRAEEIQKMATVSDGELIELRDAALRNPNSKTIAVAQKLNKEIERRNADSLEVEKAQRKGMVDKIIARVKELSKAGTDDADELLLQALLVLG